MTPQRIQLSRRNNETPHLPCAATHLSCGNGRIAGMGNDTTVLIMASDLERIGGTLNPLRSIHDTLAFSSADHGASGDRAWIYGIVCGWDCEEDNPEHVCTEDFCGDPMAEVAKHWRWDEATVVRLRKLRQAWIELEANHA